MGGGKLVYFFNVTGRANKISLAGVVGCSRESE